MKHVSKFLFLALPVLLYACSGEKVEWVSTTFDYPWQIQDVTSITGEVSDNVLVLDPSKTAQSVEGFGTAASELSWASLNILTQEERDSIFKELFAPGFGANFVMARTPIGASDFAIEYYSYDDVDGDFALDHFSIERDNDYLLPFLLSAKKANPDLKVWGSPWCPPAWMKLNKHYANTSTGRGPRGCQGRRRKYVRIPSDGT